MIGSNVSTVGGIVNAFHQAQKWGCECIQIYTTPSRTWRVCDRLESENALFKEAWKNSTVKCVIAHVPFLVNMASNKTELCIKSIHRLCQELNSACSLGIDRIVIHPGSCDETDVDAVIEKIGEGINEAFSMTKGNPVKLLLETMPGQGNQIGKTFEEIQAIIESIKDNSRIGVCCDTCHMYSAGYNIRGYSGFYSTMKEMEIVIGLEKIGAFHVNDSAYALDSKRDRHASIGEGYLGLEAFHALVNDPRFDMVPKIIENPNQNEKSLDDLQKLRGLRGIPGKIKDSPISISDVQLDLF